MDAIKKALELVDNYRNNIVKGKAFHSQSFVYKVTNERLDQYRKLLLNKKRILSVIASGDQILNSMLTAPEEIDCFDISVYPKYFFMLKLAAIQALTIEDYREFFLETTLSSKDERYDDLYFEKIREKLTGEYKEFWDALFNHSDWYDIYESGLFSSEVTINKISHIRNMYLDPRYYQLLKSQIPNCKISFKDGDIFELAKTYKEPYDLIYLSNIVSYVDKQKYKELLYNLPLKEQGIILTYMMGNTDLYKKFFSEPEFKTKVFKKENENDDSGILIFKK